MVSGSGNSTSQGIVQPSMTNTGVSVSQGSDVGSSNNVNTQTQANGGNNALGSNSHQNTIRCTSC
jgi:hypothetical protein